MRRISKSLKRELDEMRDKFTKNHLIYAPGSIWHGTPAQSGHHSKETLLKIEISRLNDFIEFLFEQSEHCDHISQREAWDEFEQIEFKNKIKNYQENYKPTGKLV